MATPLDVAQQVFALLNQVSGINATANGTQPLQSNNLSLPTSFDVSSIITFIFSFSALRDWLKLAFIGAALETTRRLVFYLWYKAYNALFITALFEDDDSAYDWMMVWLSQQPAWRQARDVQITSKTFGLSSSATAIEGEEEDTSDVFTTTRTLSYLPSIQTTFTFWYRKRWVRINRNVREGGGYYGHRVEMLYVCIFSWDHNILNKMLVDAKKAYKEAQENNISIFVSDTANDWRLMASRPKRPLESVVLDPGVKDLILDDAHDFLLSKSWYTTRGIPFRRGYLLYGAPGTGKTSIIHGLAGELGLDVYIVSLSRAGLDDNSLGRLISDLPEKCIALMEDIDAAFSQTLNRDSNEKSGESKDNNTSSGPSGKSTSRISLSGLLNALDGIGAQEGRLLFATTNKYSSLDPALCRPGRMDVHIEFKLASKHQAQELYRRFYLPDSEIPTTTTPKKDGVTDSGYSTGDEKVDEKAALIKKDKEEEGDKTTGVPHKRRAPKLSKEQVETMATKFAESIPDREFSMASLQGYLMSYKIRPHAAVDDAAAWVVKQQLEKAAKAAKDKEEEAKRKLKEEEDKKKQAESDAKKKKEEEDKRVSDKAKEAGVGDKDVAKAS